MKSFMILVIIVLISSTLSAQFKRWSNIYTIEGGFTQLKGVESNSNLTGYNFNFVYDHVSSNSSLIGGFALGYMRTNDESTENSVTYSSIPIVMQGKWFAIKDSRAFYLVGGAGIHFSEAEYYGSKVGLIRSDSGLLLLAGLGSFITLDETIFIKIAYNFNWLDSHTYQNGIFHTIKIGLAFQ